jgi:hypothetical protein
MDQIINGFLFGLGLLPILLIYRWSADKLMTLGIGDALEDFAFDRRKIIIQSTQVKVDEESVTVVGELENTSDQSCEYVNVDCDLLVDGKLFDHQIAIVSNAEPNSLVASPHGALDRICKK